MSYPKLFTTPGLGEFADAVDAERARQLAKWGDQRLTGDDEHANSARHTCQSLAERGLVAWRDILWEEIAEAFAETDPTLLRAELVQCAAVIQAWVSDLDRRPR
jgi:hypothetical protein